MVSFLKKLSSGVLSAWSYLVSIHVLLIIHGYKTQPRPAHPNEEDQFWPEYDEDIGQWTIPGVMVRSAYWKPSGQFPNDGMRNKSDFVLRIVTSMIHIDESFFVFFFLFLWFLFQSNTNTRNVRRSIALAKQQNHPYASGMWFTDPGIKYTWQVPYRLQNRTVCYCCLC